MMILLLRGCAKRSTCLASQPNHAMSQVLDAAAGRKLRPQPASASSVPDGKC